MCACVRHACVLVRPGDRVVQGHVLGACERQSVCAVVVHHFRDAGEHTAALVQRVAQALAALSLSHDDMHTALAGPAREQKQCRVTGEYHCDACYTFVF